MNLWQPLAEAPFFEELARRVNSRNKHAVVSGLVESSRALLLLLLARRSGRPLLLVTADDTSLESYQGDLATFAELLNLPPQRIATLPALDADPYDGIPPHPEVVRERVLALGRLHRRELDVLLTPVRSLLQPIAPPSCWKQWIQTIRVGDTLPPDRFVLDAMALGYRRVDIVSAPGEISRRGGIVDLYPPERGEPTRIELFGDDVESIRGFDTDNQRSTGTLHEVRAGPASENPPADSAVRRLASFLDAGLREVGDDRAQLRRIREQLDQLENQGHLPSFESLTSLTIEGAGSLFEHTGEMILAVDEPEQVEDALARAVHDLRGEYEGSDNRVLPPPEKLFVDPLSVRDGIRAYDVALQELAGEEPSEAEAVFSVACRRSSQWDGRIPGWIETLTPVSDNGVQTLCVMRTAGSRDRLVEILNEETSPSPLENGSLSIAIGRLRRGFELPDLKLQVVTELDLFGEKRRTAKRKPTSRAAFLSDFRDLKAGSLVVHTDHGIARYAGLGRPKGGSLNRDFMLLEFERGDRLFVPVDRLDLVQKYSGVGGKKPKLDRLGGPGWERAKSKVRKSVQEMAGHLLELYAQRKSSRGIAFSADTPWQSELEDSFPYELTVDQQRAVEDIKKDMESLRVADRLLVGDVGFGKTEVAVRAAFKAVMDGYQVAVLAPTTVLAQQHFQTFSQRLAPFPAKVDLVSRFRSAAEIRETLRRTADGEVDVLIGTHRLLSKDVVFKKLGLLVVDEEQRFGVAHKERLKQLSRGIDVISMTATPIPRTLQMSLAGVRDLSIIETPPPGRMSIQSYIVPFRKNVIAQAIRQEIRRDGQVFVVHNRVETLPALARAIEEMVPEARLAIGHGQMNERKLEDVMRRFVRYDADVLVTTTIIENGLDIPRANTIIVNRADRFGLAQLYQLRGRVGRSEKPAYAYFIVPSRQHLPTDARQRLRALQEFSELGAGFRLAAADLEIRGAGELLGSRQHGHIAALGFDLYCQMLERAVHEQQGEVVAVREPATLALGIDVKIPESYLADANDRLVLYKRLAQAADSDRLDRLQEETEDRYGHLPDSARRLFELGQLRLLAEQTGVRSIDLVGDELQIRFRRDAPVSADQVLELVTGGSGSLTPSGMMRIPAPPRGADRIQSISALLKGIRIEETEATS
ncbi:MAG: transcription-repair coupling factor, partial [Acidobacteriota bacterium]|nr:transcription-repair coupling factor [Acidobacteriota bacterium]MDH3785654.1 transcription-repair coupling factor [Acidobacteriota bacterium]